MKYLEIITLRSATNPEMITIKGLVKKIKAGDVAEGLLELRLYQNASVENDISVHIQREAPNGYPGKSPLGLQLARLFREYGLVSHSLWIGE